MKTVKPEVSAWLEAKRALKSAQEAEKEARDKVFQSYGFAIGDRVILSLFNKRAGKITGYSLSPKEGKIKYSIKPEGGGWSETWLYEDITKA